MTHIPGCTDRRTRAPSTWTQSRPTRPRTATTAGTPSNRRRSTPRNHPRRSRPPGRGRTHRAASACARHRTGPREPRSARREGSSKALADQSTVKPRDLRIDSSEAACGTGLPISTITRRMPPTPSLAASSSWVATASKSQHDGVPAEPGAALRPSAWDWTTDDREPIRTDADGYLKVVFRRVEDSHHTATARVTPASTAQPRCARMRLRYQAKDAFGVRTWVSWSTWTSPKRWWKPSAHSKLSIRVQVK